MTTTKHRGPKYERLLRQERLLLDATEAVADGMQKAGITCEQLGQRAKWSRGHAKRVMSSREDITLREVADAAHVLGMKPKVLFELLRVGYDSAHHVDPDPSGRSARDASVQRSGDAGGASESPDGDQAGAGGKAER